MKVKGFEKGGFEEIGPLRGKVSSVRIAFRPVEPLLEERISSLMSELRSADPPQSSSLALAVRAVDGFFVTTGRSDPLRGPLSLVRVIEYDPIRQVFLLAGDRDPDPWAVLFWYCFKVFPQDGVACAFGDPGEPVFPDEPEARAGSLLGCMSRWKVENPLRYLDRSLFRCPTMDTLRDHLLKMFKELKDQDQERSQGS
jgi:hypothetical protein